MKKTGLALKTAAHFRKHYPKYLLFAIIAYFVVSQITWVFKDQAPTAWDDSWNLLVSNYYYKTAIGTEQRSQTEFGAVYPIFAHATLSYPPFFRLSSLPLYLLLGFSPDVALLTNLFFYLLLIYGVYFIGKRVSNTGAAIFAVFLVSTFPLLVGLARVYLLDFAIAALSIAGLALFIQTENFAKRRTSLLFGLVFALGVFTKIHYPFIVLPAMIILFVLNNLRKKWTLYQTGNLLIAAAACLLLVLLHIKKNFSSIMFYLTRYSSQNWAAHEGDPSWRTLEGAFYYVRELISGISFLYFILFCIAVITLVIAVWRKKHYLDEQNKVFYCLLFFILSNIALFTYVANKDARFILPVYPAVAIITSAGIWKILINTKVRIICLSLIVVFGMVQINSYSMNYKPFGKDLVLATKIGNIPIVASYNYYLIPPSQPDWKIKDVLLLVKEDIEKTGQGEKTVGVYSDQRFFNYINFQMYSYWYDIPTAHMSLGGSNYESYDYLVIKEGDVGNKNVEENVKVVLQAIQEVNTYTELRSFQLPDGTNARIFKRK